MVPKVLSTDKMTGVRLLMPYCRHETLWHTLHRFRKETIIHALLFQVIFTLASIHKRYPTFRHNDLNAWNILVEYVGDTQEYKTYTFDNHLTFKVPTHGYHAYIADFDCASMPPIVCNYKTIELSMCRPGLGISMDPDHRYDVSYLMEHLISSNVLPPCIMNRVSSYTETLRAPPHLLVNQPTATELLVGPLFAEWQIGKYHHHQIDSTVIGTPQLPPKTKRDYDIEELADMLRPVLTSLGREHLLNCVISTGRQYVKEHHLEDMPNRWLVVFVSAAIRVVFYEGRFGVTDFVFSRTDWIGQLKTDELTDSGLVTFLTRF